MFATFRKHNEGGYFVMIFMNFPQKKTEILKMTT